jgi:class 3 adenylate cyclase
LFKIDVIGDAYLAVTNLVQDQEDDHAKRIAEFAVDAVKAASEVIVDEDDPSKGNVQIRVGFHSGPVIADVIGTRLPKYSIFGDTVNTSSRMESNSLPGRIQCSSTSAKLLSEQAPTIPLASRGHIHVKGKGEMHTFWVNEMSKDGPGLQDSNIEKEEVNQDYLP